MNKNHKPQGTNGKKAIAAIRTSKLRERDKRGDTAEEKRDNNEAAFSPQAQLELARMYAKRMDLELDEKASLDLADLGVSGSKVEWRKRPGMPKIYDLLKKGVYQHVLTYKAARIGRNLRDSLDAIDAFESLGAQVHDIRESVDASISSGRMLRHMLLAVAEYQSEDLSSTIQDVVLTRAKKGDIAGRFPLMWLNALGNGQFEVIPEMEFAMRRMVELRMAGLGYRKNAKQMNEDGLRTINGKLWTQGATYKYLSPTYIDSMTGTAFLNRDLPPDHDYHVRIENALPRILSDEEADALRAVQAVYKTKPMQSHIPGAGTWMTNNAKVRRKGRVRADSKYLLASVAFCVRCGATLLSMQHTNDRPNKRAYHCDLCGVAPEDDTKGGKQIVADSLEDAVLRVIRHVLQEPPAPRVKPAAVRVKKARTADDVNAQMKYLLDMHMAGALDKDHFGSKYEALREERDRLMLAEAAEETPDAHTREAAERLLAQAGETITHEQLRQLILMLVKRVEAVITLPGVHVRGPKTGLRRHARVTLNIADTAGVTTWLVPTYLPRYARDKDAPFPDFTTGTAIAHAQNDEATEA